MFSPGDRWCGAVCYKSLCFWPQEWARSPGIHVLATRGQAEPPADHGAGSPHPEGTHFQGETHTTERKGLTVVGFLSLGFGDFRQFRQSSQSPPQAALQTQLPPFSLEVTTVLT